MPEVNSKWHRYAVRYADLLDESSVIVRSHVDGKAIDLRDERNLLARIDVVFADCPISATGAEQRIMRGARSMSATICKALKEAFPELRSMNDEKIRQILDEVIVGRVMQTNEA